MRGSRRGIQNVRGRKRGLQNVSLESIVSCSGGITMRAYKGGGEIQNICSEKYHSEGLNKGGPKCLFREASQ